MTYKPSILNVASGLYLVGCIAYLVIKYKELSGNEGWGVVGLFGLITIGAVLFLVDFLIQLFVKNRTAVNIIGLVIAVITGVLLFVDFN
jgi:uncharacterized membrane protein